LFVPRRNHLEEIDIRVSDAYTDGNQRLAEERHLPREFIF
jgi:hypothetical protein